MNETPEESLGCLEWGCRYACGHDQRAYEEEVAWEQHKAAMEAETEAS